MGIMAARDDIPPAHDIGRDHVDLSATASAKVELYQAMRADGVGKAALARRLGVALPQVDRLLTCATIRASTPSSTPSPRWAGR